MTRAQVDLSRRAGKVWTYVFAYDLLDRNKRLELTTLIMQAEDFDSLPQYIKTAIIEAEKDLNI